MGHVIDILNWHPATLNKLLGCHWAEANRLKRADMQMIGVYAHKAKIPKAIGKRSVGLLITLGKGQRAADPDAYHKSLLDALVSLGYIKNDSRQWLELKPVEFSRGIKATSIILEDLG